MKFTTAISLLATTSAVVALKPFPARLTLSAATTGGELDAWNTKIQVGYTGKFYTPL